MNRMYYIVIKKGKKNRPIGRVVEGKEKGKVVFIEHLLDPHSPIPYGEIRCADIEVETEKWAKASRLAIPEMVPAPIDDDDYDDDDVYPHDDVCSTDWTIELNETEGKIASVLLTVHKRFTYRKKSLREFKRPTHLDRNEVYQCPITTLDIHWQGSGKVFLSFAIPKGVKTTRYLPPCIYLGELDELENPFVDENLNKLIQSAKKDRETLFNTHKAWWQNLSPDIKKFLTTIKNCEWWETEDGRFVNHNPHLGYDGNSLRIKLFPDIQVDTQLASIVQEKLDISRRKAHEDVGYCEIFTKSFKYYYRDLVIKITIFVDTDGGYDTTGDEIVIRKK